MRHFVQQMLILRRSHAITAQESLLSNHQPDAREQARKQSANEFRCSGSNFAIRQPASASAEELSPTAGLCLWSE
jgi:hypothetical protein